jgi:hypothetical protein
MPLKGSIKVEKNGVNLEIQRSEGVTLGSLVGKTAALQKQKENGRYL